MNVKNTISIPVRSTGKGKLQPTFQPDLKKSRAECRANKNNLTTEFKSYMDGLKNYKNPSLYCGSSSEWYVEYYYRIPGTEQFKRFKERFDIGRMRSKYGDAYAKQYGQEAVHFMRGKLAEGWNPFTAQKRNAPSNMKILASLELVKEQLSSGATKTMKASYVEIYNRLIRFVADNKMESRFMVEFTANDAEKFKTDLLEKYRLSAKTVNSSISYASTFWKTAKKNGHAIHDIFELVDRIRKDHTAVAKELFEPFTTAEMCDIVDALKSKGQYDFLRFVLFIYYSWSRPVEICRLLVEDINLTEGTIRFRAGKTKNGKAAFVQIVPPLKELLLEMKLDQYPADHFLFSIDNLYLPGRKNISPDSHVRRWQKYIKDTKTGLGLDKEMYGMKHTGNIHYLLNNKGNTNLKWQQMQNRHGSATMTERYIRKLGAFFIEVGNINFHEFK